MWKFIRTIIDKNVTTRYIIMKGDEVLSYQQVIDLWKESSDFRLFYIDLLQRSQYEAFFWEVKPITKDRLSDSFEFVLIDSPRLTKIETRPHAFEEHINSEEWVVTFANLGGDAQLVVPTDKSDHQHYTHLAKFVRNAPVEQVEAFWKILGEQFDRLIGEKPKWLSTAGLGVYWLHARVDSRPKYYRFGEYRVWK